MPGRREFARQSVAGLSRILEVGSEVASMLEVKSDVYFLDIIATKGPNKVRGDACRMPFRDASFDAVVAGELIEHLARPEQFLKEAHRVLAHGGRLIITTPNRMGWLNRLSGHLEPDRDRARNPVGRLTKTRSFKKLVGYSVSPPQGYGIEHRHKMLFERASLIKLCSEAGFQVQQVDYCSYGGWPGRVGRMVGLVRRTVANYIPNRLQECLIILCSKKVN